MFGTPSEIHVKIAIVIYRDCRDPLTCSITRKLCPSIVDIAITSYLYWRSTVDIIFQIRTGQAPSTNAAFSPIPACRAYQPYHREYHFTLHALTSIRMYYLQVSLIAAEHGHPLLQSVFHSEWFWGTRSRTPFIRSQELHGRPVLPILA
ncbi:unnamed protein product [Anisakis simplex]|uniref:Uncharacterized protein n=1 Tax=Anisakis simplex TaxID=6269 RepID=A0A0M3J3N3_ANISI|nr:unnamed protein product [Anisakis simplex]